MRILVAEDQHTLARNIQKSLQSEELYVVEVAFDGEEALHKASINDYDCIILDVMMPKIDGFTICKTLRENKCRTPILILTSLSQKENIIKGLDAGADDYLSKPFEMSVLCARIRALLRRNESMRSPALSAHNITLDPNTRHVELNGETIDMAPKEYALLEYLLRNMDIVQSREHIIEHVWGESEAAMFSQTLDVHVAYLRKKIGKDVITTVPGAGYMITNS